MTVLSQQLGLGDLVGDMSATSFSDSLFEMLPIAVYLCDAAGMILKYNRKAVELWGRTPALRDSSERFCGSYKLYWPDGCPLARQDTPMATVLRTGEPAHDLEVIVEQPGGKRIWALVNIDVIRNDRGEILGAVNCFQDITTRKEAERQVKESQEFLRAVIETTPECVKVVAPDGSLLQMNSAGLRMVEADDSEAVKGGCVFDLVAPEHREAWQHNHQLVCGGANLNWEFDVVGLKGTRRHMETHAVPLPMPGGQVAQLAVTRDVTERRRQEEKLRDSERRFRELLEALPMAVYTIDEAGRLTFYNQAAVDFWGYHPALGESHWCGAWQLFWPDGHPMPHSECPMAQALREKRPIKGAEAVNMRPDGRRIPFAAYPTPLYDSAGNISGAVNMLLDISHHKQAEERQQVLINELNHRVKNTLATVQSIAALTARNAPSAQEFRKTFEARLLALSNAHDLLTRGHWGAVRLDSVLSQELAPYRAEQASRIQIQGDDVELAPRAALVLAMAIHELATNAAKYGALSRPDGQVDVEWRRERTESEPEKLHLIWREHGGPEVAIPNRRGFGTRLIERSVADELKGEARIDFLPEGLRCLIRFPLRPPEPHS